MNENFATASALVAAATVLAAPMAVQSLQMQPGGSSAALEWQNQITVEKNGEQVDQIYNTLTDRGRRAIAGKLFDDTSTTTTEASGGEFNYVGNSNFTFIALANATSSSGAFDGVKEANTTLDNEIGASAPPNPYNLSRNSTLDISFSDSPASYKLKKSFTYNGSAFDDGDEPKIKVNGTGLYFNSSGPSLVSGGDFTGATLKPGDTITVTHDIEISGSGGGG
jgi:hypothetical protein